MTARVPAGHVPGALRWLSRTLNRQRHIFHNMAYAAKAGTVIVAPARSLAPP